MDNLFLRFVRVKKNPLRNIGSILWCSGQRSPVLMRFLHEATYAFISGNFMVTSGLSSTGSRKDVFDLYLPAGKLPQFDSSHRARADLISMLSVQCCLADQMKLASGFGDYGADIRRNRFAAAVGNCAELVFSAWNDSRVLDKQAELTLIAKMREALFLLPTATEVRSSFTLRLQRALFDANPRRAGSPMHNQFMTRDRNVRAEFVRILAALDRGANMPLCWIFRVLPRPAAREALWQFVKSRRDEALLPLDIHERNVVWDFLVTRRIQLQEIVLFGAHDAAAKAALSHRFRDVAPALRARLERKAALVSVCVGCRKVLSVCGPARPNAEQAGVCDVEWVGNELLHRLPRRKPSGRDGPRSQGLPILQVPLLQQDGTLLNARIFGREFGICSTCGRMRDLANACC